MCHILNVLEYHFPKGALMLNICGDFQRDPMQDFTFT